MAEYPDHQVGGICRLYLRNFMQYAECEMKPGPTLNVILGPNGAGKSSVVNGLALALGSKTNVLGRASYTVDFIRTGCHEAELEVELKGEQQNLVINRKWGMDDKSTWLVNGRKASNKEVVSLVQKFNIQTDNLCQFLPQDKVHDFSKMNSKELLSKTVEAVGASQLKEDHETLKSLQRDLADKEERFRAKTNLLTQNKNRVQTMEGDVKNFQEKQKIEKQIELLRKRIAWAKVSEAKQVQIDAKQKRDKLAKKIKDKEAELKPLMDRVNTIDRTKAAMDDKLLRENESIRQVMSKSNQKVNRHDSLRNEVETLDDRLNEAQDQENERLENIKRLDDEIARMKMEFEQESGNDTTAATAEKMAADISQFKNELAQLSRDQNNLQGSMSEHNHEKRSIESKILRLREELFQLQNVDEQKRAILRDMPQGENAVRALRWLEEHRDRFKGEIYTPIMLQINVLEAEKQAIFLENTIPARDLVAFAAENADDANALMNELRGNQRLRVNVVQVDSNPNANQYRSPDHGFGAELGFQGYLSDMFNAPLAIKNYLCKLYKLHMIPVFNNRADKHIERLVNDYKLHTFYIGQTRYTCIRSRYSNQTSTTSNKVFTKKWLKIALDKTGITRLNNQLKNVEAEHEKVHAKVRDLHAQMKTNETQLEAKRQDIKSFQQKLNYKKTLKTKWQVKEKEKSQFIFHVRPVNVENVRKEIEVDKNRKFREIERLNVDIANIRLDVCKRRLDIQRERLRMMPLMEDSDLLRREYGEQDRVLDADRIRLGEEKENVRICQNRATEALEEAHKVTDPSGRFRGEIPPTVLTEAFEIENIGTASADECSIRVQELQAHMSCLDDVDSSLIQEYKKLKKEIADLEKEIETWEEEMQEKTASMEQIRDRWLTDLTSLIEEISEGYSGFFETMGFSGEVQLGKPQEINDFVNYGIDILVKFRENVQLQKLDPFQQSGGERSVSTALYMMALQHLTKVPFRCVDEINQGMDAKNERRVFDMLIETAVRKNTAQYFLLTPKLLPDLQYDRGVTILFVYNGEEMCDYHKWNSQDIIQAEQTMSQIASPVSVR